jgi:hypothetical protein
MEAIDNMLMITNMLIIVLLWILLWIVFSGIGFLLIRLISIKDYDSEIFFSSFWLGLSIIIIFLQFWHFFYPVKNLFLVLISVLGFLGLAFSLDGVIKSLSQNLQIIFREVFLFLAFFFSFMFWLANRLMGKITLTDFGLYHLGMIRWIQNYPIVLGLGNLHGRFAFNSSYFLLTALLNFNFWNSFHKLTVGLLAFAFFIQAGSYFLKYFSKHKLLKGYEVLGIIMTIPMVMMSYFSATSTNTDFPIFLFGVLIGIKLFKLLFYDSKRDDILFDTLFIIILTATGITIKISFLTFGSIASLISVIKLFAFIQRSNQFGFMIRNLTITLIIVLIVLVPWLVRGVLLSGYIVYPLTNISFDVIWKIPQSTVNSELKWIQSWARQQHKEPQEVLGNWNWLLPWVIKIIKNPTSPVNLYLPILFLVSGLIIFIRRRDFKQRCLGLVFIFLLPSIFSIITWFVFAPDIRFAGVSFWMLGASSLLFGLYSENQKNNLERLVKVSLVCIFFVFSAGIYFKGAIIKPYNDQVFYPIPEVKTEMFRTNSGLVLSEPIDEDKCWDAPLPCTPYPDENLALIEAGNFEGGFMITNQ